MNEELKIISKDDIVSNISEFKSKVKDLNILDLLKNANVGSILSKLNIGPEMLDLNTDTINDVMSMVSKLSI
jgi:hypothetical protein